MSHDQQLQDLLTAVSGHRSFRRNAVEWLMLVAVLVLVSLGVVWMATYRPPLLAKPMELSLMADTPLRITLLNEDPNIRLFENFVTKAEARELIRQYRGLLSRSTVVDVQEERKTSEARTSSSAFLPAGDEANQLLWVLEKRAVLLSGIPLKYWETFQLTHYTAGQQYRPHFDWFDESDNNRAATIFVYLNSVELDGATEFPRLGLSVQPKEGNALMWYNCSARGNSVECDVNTEHAGRPPRSGEKFALNCWARTRPYRGA